MPNFPAANRFRPVVSVASAQTGVAIGLLNGLIDHETADPRNPSVGTWNPRAVRQEPQIGDASRGLTQILFRTAKALGYRGSEDGLFDPATNVLFGAKYLASLYARTRSWPAAISAYNGGYKPRLGFGAPLTSARRVVIAHDQATGEPSQFFNAQPGQFANQHYVDDVLRRAEMFGWTPGFGVLVGGAPHQAVTAATPAGLVSRGKVGLGLGFGIAAALAALYWLARRFL